MVIIEEWGRVHMTAGLQIPDMQLTISVFDPRFLKIYRF